MHSQIIKIGMDRGMDKGHQVLTNPKGFCVAHFLTLQTIYDGMLAELTKSTMNLGHKT
jgi:hypothetical protein